LNIFVEPFWVHKRGCEPDEYEDAACPSERTEYFQDCLRVAVADGATESLYARPWAEKLVHAIFDGSLSPCNLSAGVVGIRASWQEWLAGKTLPWFAEEKVREGTFAALVALELCSEGADEGCWHAAAVGDSCLFQIRGQEVLLRFPIDNAEAFDSRPYLLGSVGAEGQTLNEATVNGTWKKGDLFLLMTDALACWFLGHIDAGGTLSEFKSGFSSANGAESFSAWVEGLRDQGSIRNDDCTLVRIELR
jgi:hypothetical protein